MLFTKSWRPKTTTGLGMFSSMLSAHLSLLYISLLTIIEPAQMAKANIYDILVSAYKSVIICIKSYHLCLCLNHIIGCA